MLWRILIDGKSTGWVETGTGIVYDDEGARLERRMSYDTTDTAPTQPAWYVPTPPPPPEIIQRRRLLRRAAFRDRFTEAERVALERASIDVPAASNAARNVAARLRLLLRDMDSMEYIDLERPALRTLVSALETVGVIGAGRAQAILDLNVGADEDAST